MTKVEVLAIVAAMMFLYDPSKNATAADYIIRGPTGSVLGSIAEEAKQMVQRDSKGKKIGTIEYRSENFLIIRDSDGLRSGSAELGQGERIIIKNAEGVRIGTIEQDSSDRLIMRDLEGHRVGTIEGR